jgi:hypothetical protein
VKICFTCLIRVLLHVSVPWLLLLGSQACAVLPAGPGVDESVAALLAAYGRDLASGAAADPSLYSADMQALVQERRGFYQDFFLNALHSDLVSLKSSYENISVSRDLVHGNSWTVKAGELIETTAAYKLEPDGHPMLKAAEWAIEHTSDRQTKTELQAFAAMINTASYRHSTEGYETSFILQHTLVIVKKWKGFQIVEDSFTDANPQDNPAGTDVVRWQDGTFARQPVDYSSYPDYSMYHTSIEVLGQRLLDDYSK